MKKQEFKYLEQVCKDLWTWLSENLNRLKPDVFFNKFLHGCPACEISKIKDNNGYYTQDCTKCPIDEWRIKAKDLNKKGKFQIGESICEGVRSSAYAKWAGCCNSTIRKKAALEISKYRWTFLSSHKSKPFLKKYMPPPVLRDRKVE